MIRKLAISLCITVASFAQSDTVEQLFQKAFEAQQRGDAETAIATYQDLIAKYPKILEARLNLGAALSKLGRFGEAIAQYQFVIKQDPANKPGRLNLALAYYKSKDFKNAAEQFGVLHKHDPKDLQSAVLLGDSLLRIKDPDKAVAVLEPVEKINASSSDLTYVLGDALIRIGRFEEGLKRVEKVAATTGSVAANYLAAETHLRVGNHQQARPYVEHLEKTNPGMTGLNTLRGMLLEKTGRHADAAVVLGKAIEENPNDFQAHLHLGAIRYVERDIEAARRHLTKALELDPMSALAQYEMALVERASGKLDVAVAHLEKVVAAHPKWLQPHVELAALYYRLKRPNDGAKERKIVEQLTAEEHRQEMESLGIVEPVRSR